MFHTNNAPVITRRGQELIEFGFSLSLLLLLTISSIQFGLLLNTTHVLNHAARSGARFAAVHAAVSDAAIRQTVRNAVNGTSVGQAELTDSTIVITPAAGATARSTSGGTITVEIRCDLGKRIFLPIPPGAYQSLRTYKIAASAVIE